jgi:hypothetical protein
MLLPSSVRPTFRLRTARGTCDIDDRDAGLRASSSRPPPRPRCRSRSTPGRHQECDLASVQGGRALLAPREGRGLRGYAFAGAASSPTRLDGGQAARRNRRRPGTCASNFHLAPAHERRGFATLVRTGDQDVFSLSNHDAMRPCPRSDGAASAADNRRARAEQSSTLAAPDSHAPSASQAPPARSEQALSFVDRSRPRCIVCL